MGKKFSELERAVGLNNGDLAAFAQVDQSAPTGYKSKAAPMSLVSQKILKDTEYASDLQTDDKTVLGAINEVNSRTIAYDVASGPIANFKTSLELPIKSLGIDVNAVQAAGTPTPAAPLLISGWNEISLTKCGKNLLPFEDVLTEGWTRTQNGITAEYSNGIMHLYGTNELNAWNDIVVFNDIWRNNELRLPSGTFAIPDHLAVRISEDNIGYGNKGGVVTFNNSIYIRGFYISVPANFTVDWYVPMMFVYGSVIPTTYEPFNGTKEVINLGGTYYGGHLTQDKDGHRQFVVTHAKKKASDFNWYRGNMNTANTGRQFYLYFNNYPDYNSFKEMLCDSLLKNNTTNWNALNLYEFTAGSTNYLVICVEDYASAAAMLADYGDMEFTVILKNPFTIDLSDGDPIVAFQGVNNIYAVSGDASVEYALTIEEYIDLKIASVQALILNS